MITTHTNTYLRRRECGTNLSLDLDSSAPSLTIANEDSGVLATYTFDEPEDLKWLARRVNELLANDNASRSEREPDSNEHHAPEPWDEKEPEPVTYDEQRWAEVVAKFTAKKPLQAGYIGLMRLEETYKEEGIQLLIIVLDYPEGMGLAAQALDKDALREIASEVFGITCMIRFMQLA